MQTTCRKLMAGAENARWRTSIFFRRRFNSSNDDSHSERSNKKITIYHFIFLVMGHPAFQNVLCVLSERWTVFWPWLMQQKNVSVQVFAATFAALLHVLRVLAPAVLQQGWRLLRMKWTLGTKKKRQNVSLVHIATCLSVEIIEKTSKVWHL